MRSILIAATLALAALHLASTAGADAGSCAFDQILHVDVATNMAALAATASVEPALGQNGLNYAYAAVILPASGCHFTAHVVSSTSPLPAMSLHWFDRDWNHLEPDGNNGDQCDGKAPGTTDWTCPVTTPGIAWLVVDGNAGIDVTMHVTGTA